LAFRQAVGIIETFNGKFRLLISIIAEVLASIFMVANLRELTNFGEVVFSALCEELIAVSTHLCVVLPKINDFLKEVAIFDRT